MEWLWTWGGKSFGYRDGDDLWTQDGRHVGKFYENEIYGSDGKYLGEVMEDNRLITYSSKNIRNSAFTPFASRVGSVKRVNFVGYVMLVGYRDFPEL